MAPVKRKTSKKATTTANLAALKNVSNDPFLNNQQEEQEEELSINKSNNSFNSKNSSPKKLASSKSKASNNKEAKSNNGMNLEEMKVMLEDFDLEGLFLFLVFFIYYRYTNTPLLPCQFHLINFMLILCSCSTNTILNIKNGRKIRTNKTTLEINYR